MNIKKIVIDIENEIIETHTDVEYQQDKQNMEYTKQAVKVLRMTMEKDRNFATACCAAAVDYLEGNGGVDRFIEVFKKGFPKGYKPSVWE